MSKMEDTDTPKISNINEENGILTFQLSNVDVSIANSIRRTILSDIGCWGFKGFPYEESTITITKNTSRFNNEIIKHRLSCIPIHITDSNFPFEKYEFVLDVSNDKDNIILVTTNDFKIIDIDSKKAVSKTELNKIFPPDSITGDYIPILRLRPKITDQLCGESIQLTAKLTRVNANEDGVYNVVSTCSYAMTQDIEKQAVELKNYLKNIKSNLKDLNDNKEELEKELNNAKKVWMSLDAKRIVKKNSFDFVIETIGIYSNEELYRLACDSLIERFQTIKNVVNEPSFMVDMVSQEPNGVFKVILKEQDYTASKVIEYITYVLFLEDNNNRILNYCSSLKPHPHINEVHLLFHFIDDNNTDTLLEKIKMILDTSCKEAIYLYNRLKELFPH